MANSRCALKAEEWVRDVGLRELFPEKKFEKKSVKLITGGEFEFDCVDKDESIFAHISTSKGKTISGKPSTGPIHKIRGEALWFHLLDNNPSRKLFIFTESSLKEVFEVEMKTGRWPASFELIHIALPSDYQQEIEDLRTLSRNELRSIPEELKGLSDFLGEEIIEEIKQVSKE